MQALENQAFSNSRFEIVKQIGHGQFSKVFQARWHNPPASAFQNLHSQNSMSLSPFSTPPQTPTSIPTSHEFVACKTSNTNQIIDVALKHIKLVDIQDAKLREDCLKEVHLLQRLSHSNIINYNNSFIERNDLYIVLELADGGDLCKLINYFSKRNRLIIERTILKYFTQICSAVKYIHSERILHRDIKPANIFMTSKGCVKLGDFGLGRFFSNNTLDAHSLVGTFYYMSPERIQRTGYSFSSDVWSLGCVLYELITLYSPFSKISCDPKQQTTTNNNYIPTQQQINLTWLINRICSADYPSLDSYDNISQTIKDLTNQCLRPKAIERPNMVYICQIVDAAYEMQLSNSSSMRSTGSSNGNN